MNEEPVPPESVVVGDDGHFAGPVHVLGARNVNSNVRRLWSPLVNELWNGTVATSTSTRLYTDPDDANYSWIGETWCARPIPIGLTQVRVKIQVQTEIASEIRFRAHVAAGDPHYAHVSKDVTPYVAVNAAHGAGLVGGEWLEFDPLPALKDGKGLGRFWISFYRVGSATSWRIRSMIVDAYS